MSFHIRQEQFEGPLELLVELIKKEKLSISEISLGKVTDEYLQYIKGLDGADSEELAEFLVIAAYLLLLKSRALLPTLALTPEEEESIGELEERLQEYAWARARAAELKNIEAQRRIIFTREAYYEYAPKFYPPPRLALGDIETAFRTLLSLLPKKEILEEEKIRRIITLEEKITHIKKTLAQAFEDTFSQIVKGSAEKIEIIISFLALLELVKQKFVDLRQEELFEDIKITRLD